VFVMRELAKPSPKPGEVLVRVAARSLNAADYRSLRMGIIPKGKIFGADIAGWVESVGADVRSFKIGDEVFGDTAASGFGGLAEYVCAPEKLLALKPSAVSWLDAASVPMASVTALQALRDLGNVQPGQKVLIHGAGGGVGIFAVQLAKHFGAEVTAVCGPGNTALISSLGADRVIDYSVEDSLASGAVYDLILGINGSRSLTDYMRALTSKGKLVMVGGALIPLFQSIFFGWLLSIGRKKVRNLAAKPSARDLEFIIHLVEAGMVKIIIDRQYRLEETAEAFRYLSRGHARGKVVICDPPA
jgi:NADPH:quinone reductase-like Zn-dependent oxidoreductase